MSVPLSCALAFLVMPGIGFTLNMIVLFSFLLALGIVVDDAIVVIENTHRIFDNGKVPIKKAAKLATGEVFLPVLSRYGYYADAVYPAGILEQCDRLVHVLPAGYADHYTGGIAAGGLCHQSGLCGGLHEAA